MIRQEYPGGLFVDAWPTGEYVVLFPGSHLETHLGRVAFPRSESYGPMFLASTTVSGFMFAGLAHDTTGTMLAWEPTHGWVPGPVYVTGRGVFDRVGIYRDAKPAGYQFLDDEGEPVSRVATYGPTRGLSEWIETDDLLIGQGHVNGGVLVFDGRDLRTLDEGLCFFIRVHRIGQSVTVSYAKSGVGAVIVQTTLAELRALPHWMNAPRPDPEPEPEPTPEPEPMAFPNILSTLEAVRAQYPALITTTQAVEILNAVAWKHPGFGLMAKPNGNHGPQPKTGIFCSADWLVHLPSGRGADCFINGPSIDAGDSGEARTQWNDDGEPFDVSRFVEPVEPTGATKPGPDTTPQSRLIDTRMLDETIVGLKADIERLSLAVRTLEASTPQTGQPTLGGTFAIRTSNGHYLHAVNGGGGEVHSARTEAHGDELFTLEAR